MLALQGLNPGQFIVANDPLALLGQFWRLPIETIEVADLRFRLVIVTGGEPITD